MTIAEFKKWLRDNDIPDEWEIGVEIDYEVRFDIAPGRLGFAIIIGIDE